MIFEDCPTADECIVALIEADTLFQTREVALWMHEALECHERVHATMVGSRRASNMREHALQAQVNQLLSQRPSTTETLNAAERERLAYIEQHVISLNERINGAAKEAYMDGYYKGRNEGITEGQKRADDLKVVPGQIFSTIVMGGMLSGGYHKPEPPPNLFTRISAFAHKLLGFLTPSSPK